MQPVIKGAKLPAELECPFDTALYTLVDPLVDFAYNIGLTPNMVTILGGVATFLSLRSFHVGAAGSAVIWWFVSYVMDMVDGAEARRYNLETAVGDICDHAFDVVGYVGFMYVAWTYVRGGASAWPLIVTVMLGLLATHFLTCQQLFDAGRNQAIQGLAWFPMQCRSLDDMPTLRWFGVGTCNFAILGSIYYYCK